MKDCHSVKCIRCEVLTSSFYCFCIHPFSDRINDISTIMFLFYYSIFLINQSFNFGMKA